MPFNHLFQSDRARGYTSALISAVILSTTAIFIRHLTQTYHIPALILAFWRDVFVAITLLVVLGLVRPGLLRVNRVNLRYLAGYGIVLALFNALWTLSVALNGAAVATVLVYCSAGFTALLGHWLLRERLDWIKIIAILLSLGGCVLVSQALDPSFWKGSLWEKVPALLSGVLSGLFYAFYSLLGRASAQRGLSPWTSMVYTFALAAIVLLFANLLPGGILPGSARQPADFWWLGSQAAGWGILFILAAGPTILGFGFYNISLSYLPSSVANLIVTLEPAFTVITAYFLFGERLNSIQILGSLMILSGVVFLRLFGDSHDKLLVKAATTTTRPYHAG